MNMQGQYKLSNAFYDWFSKDQFRREVCCFAAEGMGIISMSSQNNMGLVEFDFFKIWEAMKSADRMPKNVWMIHTHPPGVNEKSVEDTSSIKGWATALGMPVEMVIASSAGNVHYRCFPKNKIVRRGFRSDSEAEKTLTSVLRGISRSDFTPTEEEFNQITMELNSLLPIKMWEQFEDKKYDLELFDADPDCNHVVECAPGGGVRCTNCRGWFCY